MAPMTRSQKLDELVSSVEDLLARLPDSLSPEIVELRDRVDAGIFDAWTAVASEVKDARRRAELRRSARLSTSIGLALLAGATGLIAYQVTRPDSPLA